MPEIFHLLVLFGLLRGKPLVDGSELPTFGNHAWVDFAIDFPMVSLIAIQNKACGFKREQET